MYLKVMLVGGQTIRICKYSKCMQIKDFRQLVGEKLEISESRLRLFFGGKQLEDGLTLFDYDVKMVSTVHCMIKPDPNKVETPNKKEKTVRSSRKTTVGKRSPKKSGNKTNEDKKDLPKPSISPEQSEAGPSAIASTSTGTWTISQSEPGCSPIASTSSDCWIFCKCAEKPEDKLKLLYNVGDIVEIIDEDEGAWFTVVVRDTVFDVDGSDHTYIGMYEGFDDGDIQNVNITKISATKENIRPPQFQQVQLKNVKAGDTVKVIYSLDKTKKGLWYDCVVKSVRLRAGQLQGNIIHGRTRKIEKNCTITSTDFIFRVGNPGDVLVECDYCDDRPTRKCKECGCRVCGKKNEPGKLILCDECDYGYHIWCLKPKLNKVPDTEEWYCPECKNDENEIVKAGDKPRISKKKSKMISYKAKPSANKRKVRDWGKGMACAGRSKDCTIVPANHFGPVPGVEVGQTWLFRVQVGEAGVHRPHVSGIHGRQEEGAYSIVLSGGYEDDKDEGETFLYTGCGGRDLSGNKRTSTQSRDQKLEHLNLALARNCNAPINKTLGAVSKDWQNGKPVRVIRNYRAAEHSKYAPEQGNRYDGIYKVARYFPYKGKSGFIVWRYELKRDDPIPAPWTKAGKERIASLGLEMQVPEGYAEKMKVKKQQKEQRSKNKKSASGRKRSLKQTVLTELSEPATTPSKKAKIKYRIEKEIALLIKKDVENDRIWEVCKDAAEQGKQQFLKEVQSVFNCICCQELVYKPITASCKHSFCKACMDRSFAARVRTCPHCRHDLSSEKFKVNENLQSILLALFPGYTGGR